MIIHSGQYGRRVKPCPLCLHDSYAPAYNYLLEGYDDYGCMSDSTLGFLSPGPPLIGAAGHIREIASSVKGAEAVDVGVTSWNQTALEENEYFSTFSRFAGLFVTSVHPRLVGPDLCPLEKCQDCGKQRVRWSRVRKSLSSYSLSAEHWDGADIFLIEGGDQYRGACVTNRFLTIARNMGFMNLDIVPMKWV